MISLRVYQIKERILKLLEAFAGMDLYSLAGAEYSSTML